MPLIVFEQFVECLFMGMMVRRPHIFGHSRYVTMAANKRCSLPYSVS